MKSNGKLGDRKKIEEVGKPIENLTMGGLKQPLTMSERK